jgi:hypothetical protein
MGAFIAIGLVRDRVVLRNFLIATAVIGLTVTMWVSGRI